MENTALRNIAATRIGDKASSSNIFRRALTRRKTRTWVRLFDNVESFKGSFGCYFRDRDVILAASERVVLCRNQLYVSEQNRPSMTRKQREAKKKKDEKS